MESSLRERNYWGACWKSVKSTDSPSSPCCRYSKEEGLSPDFHALYIAASRLATVGLVGLVHGTTGVIHTYIHALYIAASRLATVGLVGLVHGTTG